MKKILVTALMIGAAMLCLCGCSVGVINGSAVRYDNSDKYTAGDCEITDKIDRLDIDWVSGNVKVTTGGSSVKVKETTDAELDDKFKVHTWAEGSTLHVRYCKSGERYDEKQNKSLEITVPEGSSFEDIKIDCSSADVLCEVPYAKKAAMDASSGNMAFNGDAGSFTADTSSGNISFSGKADSIEADSSSGDVFIEQAGIAKSIDIDTSSGNATLYIPEENGFKAKISTSSGDVSYDLPLTKNGDETYVFGDGECRLDIDTSSGNVKILKRR